MRTRGVTLVELIVAIGIVVLLVAILFPVFWRARGKARETGCLTHLRELSAACLAYANDYDECLPPTSRWVGHTARYWWGDLVQSYMGGYGALICYSGTWQTDAYRPLGAPNPLICSYAMPDIRVNWAGTPISPLPGSPLAHVKDPSGTILLCDSTGPEITAGGTSGDAMLDQTDLSSVGDSHVAKRHNHGFDACFVDGHCQWLKASVAGMWTTIPDD